MDITGFGIKCSMVLITGILEAGVADHRIWVSVAQDQSPPKTWRPAGRVGSEKNPPAALPASEDFAFDDHFCALAKFDPGSWLDD